MKCLGYENYKQFFLYNLIVVKDIVLSSWIKNEQTLEVFLVVGVTFENSWLPKINK